MLYVLKSNKEHIFSRKILRFILIYFFNSIDVSVSISDIYENIDAL